MPATKQQQGIWDAYPDLTGDRFGHLTVLRQVTGKAGRGKVWLCKCDCGKKLERTTNHLRFDGQKYCHGLTCPLARMPIEEKKRRAYECNKRYVAAHREHYNKLARGYFERNKEAVRARARERYDPAKAAAKEQTRIKTMPEEYILKAMGISKKDIPQEVLQTILKVKRVQIQARRLVRNKKKENK